MFVLPPETGGMVQVETSVGPLADLSEARMDETCLWCHPQVRFFRLKTKKKDSG